MGVKGSQTRWSRKNGSHLSESQPHQRNQSLKCGPTALKGLETRPQHQGWRCSTPECQRLSNKSFFFFSSTSLIEGHCSLPYNRNLRTCLLYQHCRGGRIHSSCQRVASEIANKATMCAGLEKKLTHFYFNGCYLTSCACWPAVCK